MPLLLVMPGPERSLPLKVQHEPEMTTSPTHNAPMMAESKPNASNNSISIKQQSNTVITATTTTTTTTSKAITAITAATTELAATTLANPKLEAIIDPTACETMETARAAAAASTNTKTGVNSQITVKSGGVTSPHHHSTTDGVVNSNYVVNEIATASNKIEVDNVVENADNAMNQKSNQAADRANNAKRANENDDEAVMSKALSAAVVVGNGCYDGGVSNTPSNQHQHRHLNGDSHQGGNCNYNDHVDDDRDVGNVNGNRDKVNCYASGSGSTLTSPDSSDKRTTVSAASFDSCVATSAHLNGFCYSSPTRLHQESNESSISTATDRVMTAPLQSYPQIHVKQEFHQMDYNLDRVDAEAASKDEVEINVIVGRAQQRQQQSVPVKQVEVAVKRWGNLRERFSKEIRTGKNTSGSGATEGRQWALLESLQFLRAHIVPRPMRQSCPSLNRSGLNNNSSAPDNTSQPSTSTSPELLYLPTQSPPIPPAQASPVPLAASSPVTPLQSEPSTSRGRKRVAVHRDELDAAIMESVTTFREVCARRARREEYSAEISAFGSMMCSGIANLNIKNQALVMQRCTEILMQAKIEENDEAGFVEYLYDDQ